MLEKFIMTYVDLSVSLPSLIDLGSTMMNQ